MYSVCVLTRFEGGAYRQLGSVSKRGVVLPCSFSRGVHLRFIPLSSNAARRFVNFYVFFFFVGVFFFVCCCFFTVEAYASTYAHRYLLSDNQQLNTFFPPLESSRLFWCEMQSFWHLVCGAQNAFVSTSL